MALLQLDGVKKYYRLHRSWFAGHDIVKAVDGVSFSIEQGESFGIVGESGCGKSTLAKLIVMLESLTAGNIHFAGENLAAIDKNKKRQIRKDMQIVFQDTYASLNPRFSIRETLEQPLYNFSLQKTLDTDQRIREMLDIVELSESTLRSFPAELSGGQRQRVCIARALILQPRFIIFDEATSGLDVTLQSQILNILLDLRKRLGLTYLFITHNLQLLSYMTDRVGVMYMGKLVETIASQDLKDVKHPYSQALLSAIPVQHPRQRGQRNAGLLAKRDAAQTGAAANGCSFYPRCPQAQPICRNQAPKIKNIENGSIACHNCG